MRAFYLITGVRILSRQQEQIYELVEYTRIERALYMKGVRLELEKESHIQFPLTP